MTESERQAAAALIGEHRRLEEVCRVNDISGFSLAIVRLERDGNFPEAEQARRAREKADHALFLNAQEQLYFLREKVANAVIPILRKIHQMFDRELCELAIAREQSMTNLGIPLFVERPSEATHVVINGIPTAGFAKDWKLLGDEECSALHSCRELAWTLLRMFEHGSRGYIAAEIRHQRGLVTLEFLASGNDTPAFSWF